MLINDVLESDKDRCHEWKAPIATTVLILKFLPPHPGIVINVIKWKNHAKLNIIQKNLFLKGKINIYNFICQKD
jgi:hypothetical protein